MKSVTAFFLATAASARVSEVWTPQQEAAAGIVKSHILNPLPHELLGDEALPEEYSWCNVDGVSYCTRSRNQHLPQYCGSCWAHGAVSALGDRIKIARKAKGVDVDLSVQHMLNCGTAGTCHGGSVVGPYAWIKKLTQTTGTGIAYESVNPYQACSSDSKEGFCGVGDYTCSAKNLRAQAYTCSTFTESGGFCHSLNAYPNATISEYGTVRGEKRMMAEILKRGPISCGIDAGPLDKYTGGVVSDHSGYTNHVISITGWGVENGKKYWQIRNSWGEAWGYMGYGKVERGTNALKIEEECAWAVPDSFSEVNVPCYEDGTNC